jgi:hypothetical protein
VKKRNESKDINGVDGNIKNLNYQRHWGSKLFKIRSDCKQTVEGLMQLHVATHPLVQVE